VKPKNQFVFFTLPKMSLPQAGETIHDSQLGYIPGTGIRYDDPTALGKLYTLGIPVAPGVHEQIYATREQLMRGSAFIDPLPAAVNLIQKQQ
jgi:hypothetical protein